MQKAKKAKSKKQKAKKQKAKSKNHPTDPPPTRTRVHIQQTVYRQTGKHAQPNQ